MKKLSAIVLSLLLTLAFTACSSSVVTTESTTLASQTTSTASTDLLTSQVTDTTKAPKKDIYIAMISKSFVGDFWKTVEIGARAAADENGVTLTYEGPDTETNIEQQIKLVENAIIKKADVIVLSCLDSDALVPAIESANAAGIKVITFNSVLNSDIPLTLVATDNWKAGEMAGKALGEALGGKGKYAIIGAVEAVKNNRDRSDGAADYITKNFPEMQLVTIQYTDNDLNKALAVTSDIITANPDIAGFFSNNETTTIGVATILEEKGKTGSIKHVGFDATQQTIGYLSSGITDAIITQVPYQMGYLSVISAIDACQGKQLEPVTDTGAALVTLDNLMTPEIQKIVNPLG